MSKVAFRGHATARSFGSSLRAPQNREDSRAQTPVLAPPEVFAPPEKKKTFFRGCVFFVFFFFLRRYNLWAQNQFVYYCHYILIFYLIFIYLFIYLYLVSGIICRSLL
eukprot:Rmarinus@m.17313